MSARLTNFDQPKMKIHSIVKIYCSFLLLFAFTQLTAQEVTAERIANLDPQVYTIEGEAILRAYDNGVLELSLTDDFTTPSGPDIRMFLAPSLTLEGAVEIVDLSSINHFAGAYTINVPDEIAIEDYDYILFYCVAFQQFWASGQFGETMFPGGDYECSEHTVSSIDSVSIVDICPTDAIDDIVEFTNSLSLTTEDHYVYLLTTEEDVLLEVIPTAFYNFSNSGPLNLRVYGMNYDGELNPQIGVGRLQTTATGCFVHSSADSFLTVSKNACPSATFDAELAKATLVYPVPAKEQLTVSFPSGFEPTIFQVTDVTGRVVLQPTTTSLTALQIDVSQLTQGVYSLQMWQGRRRAVSKRFMVLR